MRTHRRPVFSRLTAALAAAVGSLAGSIALPTVFITLYAVRVRDVAAITSFAGSVAEPLGLLGAAAATFGIARLSARLSRAGRAIVPWVGGGAAVSMVGAAFWVGDVDVWTAAAGVTLPVTAMLAVRRYRAPVVPAPVILPAPPVVAAPHDPPALVDSPLGAPSRRPAEPGRVQRRTEPGT